MLPLGGVVDLEQARLRIGNDIATAEREIARHEAKLANEHFLARAPQEVVEEHRERHAEAVAARRRLARVLERFG